MSDSSWLQLGKGKKVILHVLCESIPTRDDLNPEAFNDLLLVVGPFGKMAEWLGYPKDCHILYLFVDAQAKELLREEATKPNGDLPIFPMHRPIGGRGTIEMFWSRRRATYGVVAAIQYHVVADADQTVLGITHMSVRKPWRRNHINTHLMNWLRKHTLADSVKYYDLTQDGKKFVENYR
jgi:hypothetical protein